MRVSKRFLQSSAVPVTLLLMGAPHAQDAPASGANVAEVVVTGSRIVRQDYVADSPVVTFGAEQLEAMGPSSLENTFNALPQFAALQGGTSASAAKQGRSSANLRGLGIARTLVLLDGKRMQPSDALGTIDLNTISPALIESVEVITGGASAVYGSDAIAGVVNMKVKRDFSGLEIDAQFGETERGDGETTEVSLTAGGNFADDRGNAVLSMSYYDRKGIFGAERDFFRSKGVAGVLRGGVVTAAASNLPTQAAMNSVFVNGYGAGSTPLRNQAIGVNRDGTLFTSTTPILNLRYADHDPYIINEGRVGFALAETYYLQQPMERYTFFGRGQYDLGANIEAYAQVNYAKYDSSWTRNGNTATSASAPAFIPVTNPFIPQDLRTILASRQNPTAPIDFSFNTGRVGVAVTHPHYDVSQFMFGFTGKALDDWTWDVYGSWGETRSNEIQDGYIDRAAWAALVNAPDGGASVCPGGFNPFLPDPLQLDPAQRGCYEFLNRTLQESTTHEQQIVEATLQGGLVDLPAGRLRFAAGASYRNNAYDFQPASERTARTVYPDQATGPTGGSVHVNELFGEVLIPVLKDLPAVHELNLDFAYRFSDYSTIGEVSTYKGSVDWAPLQSLRVRGGYQRAIRAPALAELYAPPERSLPQIGAVNQGGGDPCDITGRLRTSSAAAQVRALCLAQGLPASVADLYRFTGSAVPAITAGNLDLEEEVADTYTVGLVWRSPFDSPWLSGFTASIDYYDISVEQSIGVITTTIALNRCFNADGASNPTYSVDNYYCRLVSRNPNSGGIEQIVQPTLNLAAYRTSGIDTQLDWRFDVGPGALGVNLVLSFLDRFEIQNLEGQPFLDYAGTIGNMQVDPFTLSYPEWKVTASVSYSVGQASAMLRARHYDSMSHASDVGVPNPSRPGVESRQYFDLSARYEFSDAWQLRVGIVNLLDEEPPEWTTGSVADPALYDIIQRRFYVGINKHF
jgi:iron complex outermembrane recepter protein